MTLKYYENLVGDCLFIAYIFACVVKADVELVDVVDYVDSNHDIDDDTYNSKSILSIVAWMTMLHTKS